MSSPRKIWIADDAMRQMRFHGMVCIDPVTDADLYHHDDVVRELVSVGSNMHAFVDMYGDETMRLAAAEWRAALAKIAQV